MPRGRSRFGGFKRLAASIALVGPVLATYLAHYYQAMVTPDVNATGFLLYDMPYYLANAREYLDSATMTPLYGNPFSFSNETPKIYFQPLTLLMALIWGATHSDPGLLFAVLGVIFAVACVRVAIAVFDHLFGLGSVANRLGLVCFVWGGG
jgi:hypothetical protein